MVVCSCSFAQLGLLFTLLTSPTIRCKATAAFFLGKGNPQFLAFFWLFNTCVVDGRQVSSRKVLFFLCFLGVFIFCLTMRWDLQDRDAVPEAEKRPSLLGLLA